MKKGLKMKYATSHRRLLRANKTGAFMKTKPHNDDVGGRPPLMTPLIMSFLILVGCTTDVSNQEPYNKLIDNIYILNQDSYITEFDDNKGSYILEPCISNLYIELLYDKKYEYSEKSIGNIFNGIKIVGALRRGTKIKVVRVMKRLNPEMGSRYSPIGVVISKNNWKRELDLYWLYESSKNKETLDPEYVKRVFSNN